MAIFDFNTPATIGRWEQRSVRSINKCCGRLASPSEMQSARPRKKGANGMNNTLTYTKNGDYLIPDLKLSEQQSKPLASTAGCGKRI